MQIIIDIPENYYNDLKTLEVGENEHLRYEMELIRNGIPLPKECGRLMILSEDKLIENQMDLSFSCQKWISEVGLSNATVAIIEEEKK